MASWIDTHCHLDASEFAGNAAAVRQRATLAGVGHCVYPAVCAANFAAVRALAHAHGDSYALGIHPLYVARADEADLALLAQALAAQRSDPHLVAVGEIGLDYFVPELRQSPLRERQQHFFHEQLKLAHQFELPVLLHLRRAVDQVLRGLRAVGGTQANAWHGIAHAFHGSEQQARSLLALGLKLGFGGALTYARALQLRRLAATLPLQALVLETDAPDMPAQWRYKTARQRAAGELPAPNEPGDLPRIGAELAALREISAAELQSACAHNTLAALPRLRLVIMPAS